MRTGGTALALLALVLAATLTGGARAETAGSQARSYQAGLIDAGFHHACAILHDGSAACWGSDGSGQLGDGAALASKQSPSPVVLPAGRTARSLSAGGDHTCAVLDDGSATCWGADGAGELGDNDTLGSRATPVPVALPAGRRATAITAGFVHSCAVLDDGSAVCWGRDAFGELGNDPTFSVVPSPTPVAVALPPGRRATAISAGDDHTCALLDDGGVVCWGSDLSSQLGNDATLAPSGVPVPVALPAGRRAVALASGALHACALLDDGTARCWGEDLRGQLGDDAANANQPVPVPVALPAGAVPIALAAGAFHTCAVAAPGAVSCWGRDQEGELGEDVSLANRAVPVGVGLPPDRLAVALAAGTGFTCALLDRGDVTCWGRDVEGELGNGLDPTQQPVASAAPPALAPSSSTGRVADVSVALEGAPAGLVVGASALVTVRVTNQGPDAASDLRVRLGATRLELAPTAVAQGSASGASWLVGTLAAGGQATLTVSATGLAAGAGSLSAELVAQVEGDPDSSPANDAPGEDDQAVAAIPLTAAPAPPPGPAPGPVAPDRLTLALTPGRDATAPHATRASGRLVVVGLAPSIACAGKVTVTGKAGRTTLVTRTAALRLVDGACQYAASLSVGARRRGKATTLRVTATFAGNAALRAATSKARTLRLS